MSQVTLLPNEFHFSLMNRTVIHNRGDITPSYLNM